MHVAQHSGRRDSIPLALLDAPALAALLGVTLRTVRKLDSAGRIPSPVRIGRCVRWSPATIAAWIDAGAPSRQRFAAMQGRK